ncbi:kinase-like domain-containing protein [Gautieria morchelliformis]|nr:kinase-like domain-containing protein [Gautieria morchelliformis]
MLNRDPMQLYRSKKETTRRSVLSKYSILGFISSGTYGRVYKAQSKDDEKNLYAIKKFKPDKEGEVVTYTGISQSAIREIALNREIKHENIVSLKEVMLEDKSIYMVFEYAEHDFLQVIHHYAQTLRSQIPISVLKSLIHQLLNGLLYLHESHILHRDLKPANILITAGGIVKIGDLGLARLTYQPLQPLFTGDKVVVTIWYRAPELLLGARHYNKAVDCWAVGCVLAELISLRPIFKGEEAKLDSKKNVPFQRDQLLKIFEVLGTPNEADWPGLRSMPEYNNMLRLDRYGDSLFAWTSAKTRSPQTLYDLLTRLFQYDPDTRITAKEALAHKWFHEDPKPNRNAFFTVLAHQAPPQRRISHDEAPTMVAVPNSQSLSQPHSHSLLNGNGNNGSRPTSGTGFGMPMSRLGGGSGTTSSRKKARLE